MTRDRCAARVSPKYGGHRCMFAGKHKHRTEAGDTLRLCKTHYDMLVRREQDRSPEEVIARWLER